jgi:hypothetical protein
MITQERLKELVNYDPETGVFTSIARRRKVAVGNQVGHLNGGYVRMSIDGHRDYGHRFAVLYMTGMLPPFVDHKDLNTANNKWENLRECDRVQNNGNRRVDPEKNKSGYKGVHWATARSKWCAQISIGNKPKFLGYFDDPAIAHQAYMRAAENYFGEFARAT